MSEAVLRVEQLTARTALLVYSDETLREMERHYYSAPRWRCQESDHVLRRLRRAWDCERGTFALRVTRLAVPRLDRFLSLQTSWRFIGTGALVDAAHDARRDLAAFARSGVVDLLAALDK